MDAIEEKEIQSLREELDFYKSLWEHHSMSVICMMHIKYRNGKRVWVNLQEATYKLLETLDNHDTDPDIIRWKKDAYRGFGD